MRPGLVQCGAEKALGHLTAHPGAYGHGIKGIGTGFLQWCLAGGQETVTLVKGVNFHS